MSGSTTERREVLFADFDHFDPTRALWFDSPAPTERDHTRDQLVRRAVQECLSEKQREVIVAHYFEGRSQSQIARALGVRQQVVQKRIHGTRRRGELVGGALKRLAAFLGPQLGK